MLFSSTQTLRRMTAPIIKRKTHSKRPAPPGMADLPTSGGGWVFRLLRPYLPAAWQYGWRYRALQVAWVAMTFSFVVALAKEMWFQGEDDIARKAARFSYVRDESGTVVDISYKPLIDAGMRARRRNERLMEQLYDEDAAEEVGMDAAGVKH